VDLHHVDADPDPDSIPYILAYHLQIVADPDPAFHFDTDPDPDFI
jgi:hypothetical protein